MSNAAQWTALVSRQDTLRRIFYNQNIMSAGNLHNKVHLAADSRIMHWQNYLGARSDRDLDFRFVDVQGIGANVHEYRCRAAQNKGIGGRHKRVRRHDDFVARPYSGQNRRHLERRGTRVGQEGLLASGALFQPGTALFGELTVARQVTARVRLRGDASVFVIAREVGGAPMPVAAEKRSVSELPLVATLDDGDSPMPTRKLSQLREVELIARLSTSGTANRQQGDVESKPVRITLPSRSPVELVIGAN